jgi:hypothetical protein
MQSTALTINPSSIDILQSTKFRLTFSRLPTMTFLCQVTNIPGLSLTEIIRPTPFVDTYHPGEKLIYDTLNVSFLVSEDFSSWMEVHDWLRALTFPTEFEEYARLSRLNKMSNVKIPIMPDRNQFSDATLTVYTNKNNPNFRINFVDVFPISLSSIPLSTGDSAENIVTADAQFRYSYYNFEKL